MSWPSKRPGILPGRTVWDGLRSKATAATFLTIVMIGVVGLSADARREIEILGTASGDSTNWALSQAEVEFARFQLAIALPGDPTPRLADLRQSFDVVYSRLATISSAPVFAPIRDDPESAVRAVRAKAFLDELIPLIDGSDQKLILSLPEIAQDAVAVRADLRALSLNGVKVYSARTEAQREKVWKALVKLAVLTTALVLMMIAASVALARLARQNKRAYIQQAEASRRFEAIVQTSLDAIIVADVNGRVIDFNRSAEEIFHYSATEAIGQSLDTLIVPDHLRARHRAGMRRLQDGGAHRVVGKGRILLDGRRKDGSTLPLEVSIAETSNNEQRVFVSYLRDVTAQQAADAELVATRDKAVAGEKAKADLLAVMSHEMRTPLNGMLGTLELLAATRMGARQKTYVDIIGRSGQILLQHVNDVLDVSRLDAGKMELTLAPLDPVQLIHDILDALRETAAKRGNQLSFVDPGSSFGLRLGDRTRLQQVMLNLIGNAIKFTQGGSVTVHLSRGSARDDLLLEVTDTGIGIAPEQVDKIFQDFVTLDSTYRRTAEGTGLGLGICKRLITTMKGEIGVESAFGEGSRFWVRLPLPSVAPAAPPKPTNKTSDPPKHTIAPGRALDLLVVEDNEINRFVLREMLVRLGHKVTEAITGEEGVAQAAIRRFDAILMDISMPGMDGVSATQAIRAGGGPCAGIPIFALTAHALPEDLARFKEAGMTDAMTKPISSQVLATTLSRAATPRSRSRPRPGREALPDRILDEGVIAELVDLFGPDRAGPHFAAFAAEVEEALPSLQKDIRPGMDFAAFEGASHKIAGSAAVFGAAGLRTVLLAAEGAARATDLAGLKTVCADLVPIWAETRSALTVRLGSIASHGKPD